MATLSIPHPVRQDGFAPLCIRGGRAETVIARAAACYSVCRERGAGGGQLTILNSRARLGGPSTSSRARLHSLPGCAAARTTLRRSAGAPGVSARAVKPTVLVLKSAPVRSSRVRSSEVGGVLASRPWWPPAVARLPPGDERLRAAPRGPGPPRILSASREDWHWRPRILFFPALPPRAPAPASFVWPEYRRWRPSFRAPPPPPPPPRVLVAVQASGYRAAHLREPCSFRSWLERGFCTRAPCPSRDLHSAQVQHHSSWIPNQRVHRVFLLADFPLYLILEHYLLKTIGTSIFQISVPKWNSNRIWQSRSSFMGRKCRREMNLEKAKNDQP